MTDTCYVAAPERPVNDTFHIHVPRMKDLISSKVLCLPLPYRPRFESLLKAHDQEVDKYCATLERTHHKLVSKQLHLFETFTYMIDDVIRIGSKVQGSQQPDTQTGQCLFVCFVYAYSNFNSITTL
jgi:hypothetical protein